MPTNDFLAFATAPGANVSLQTDYAALAARSNGFSAGVASSAQVNKALRQSAFVAAAVAQFTADLQAGNVADDGIIANFETQLKNAIVAQAATAFTGANRNAASTGYQKLPGGLILQWGLTPSIAAGVAAGTTFPIAFPGGVFAITATYTNTNSTTPGGGSPYVISQVAATGFNLFNGGSGSSQYYYFAIGA